ncbi:MAG: iron-sulfur cluster assembly scaffold protein [Kiritimatiellia bacterium]
MYEDTLLQLSRDRRFRDSEAPASPLSERRNPACGDEVFLSGHLEEGRVDSLRFYAQGCAVCVASTVALCELLNGCAREEAKSRITAALKFFDSDAEWEGEWGEAYLPALGAVRARPMRMSCVRLAWEALRDVL